MSYSIIIINYKTCELIAACIKNLLDLPEATETEIIVIDNASNDGSVEFLQEKFGDRIKLIVNKSNLGFASANNQGAASAHGEFLLFLNSDTIIKEDIFSACSNIFQQNKNIGIISPRLLMSDNKYQPASFGNFPTLWRLITQKTKIDPVLDENKEYNLVDWVSGCALMIRKELFTQLKGWDDNFFLYYEDIDLCKRARKFDYLSAVANKITITHLGGQSLKHSLSKRWHYFRSQNYYFKKHYGSIAVLILKLVRLPYKLLILIKNHKR